MSESGDIGYNRQELVCFVAKHGFGRVIMAALLIISYVWSCCETNRCNQIPYFAYAGISLLALEWINPGLVIFIMFLMPPLWFLRLKMFHGASESGHNVVTARQVSTNLETYIGECWSIESKRYWDKLTINVTQAKVAKNLYDEKVNCTEYFETRTFHNDMCQWLDCVFDDRRISPEFLEQALVLAVILLRWLLTVHLGLDQLLTYFVSTASDIVDFANTMVALSNRLIEDDSFDSLNAIIGSLSQFTVNLSGKRKHDHVHDLILWKRASSKQRMSILADYLFGTEIWGIIAQMTTEDGLLLVLRIYAVVKFDAGTLDNLFFVVKNILTLAIFTYYAAAITDSYVRHRHRRQRAVFAVMRRGKDRDVVPQGVLPDMERKLFSRNKR
ncbi:unnamed protein product [Didymodactylos carnosus]|uniref:Uncharacterized protein n=1 Tax=Didymodactylos carnosus TaxID=1234261 RepID=A0A815NZM6_9BILA|nr:unnamed protein product [Didymodactylos carnosus]CAF1442243.1 unnamed protein product [Didymodactylos carnosus]CAF3503205.1 unnamed protein product [Didymodactylos carnosus]CAF4317901.1 unnamed protein product [Didymodactylos carnosus]